MAALADNIAIRSKRYLQQRVAWLNTARPEQLPPAGIDWNIWLMLAGRGFGKTRSGAEWLKWEMEQAPNTRWAIVAPTLEAARDVCVEGESGLLACLGDQPYMWNRSQLSLTLPNGSRTKCFGAEEPNRLRGPQHHGAWCDELSSWRYEDTWDQLLFGLRLGKRPIICATTTPKPNVLTRVVMSDPTTVITTGRTFDNAENLSPTAMKKLKDKYEGTRLGRQELNAEFLDDVPGALWTRRMIERATVRKGPVNGFLRVVVGVDPSGTSNLNKTKKKDQLQAQESGNAQGIVVAGLGNDGLVYVISDDTMHGTPNEWGAQVITCFRDCECDTIVAEGNYGGDMVKAVIQNQWENAPVKMVTATRGKAVRAAPVSMLYEQNKVRHIGSFPELEDEMTNMTDQEYIGPGSPNRLDALVWAIWELMLEGGYGKVVKVKFG